jgi:hypothetical protein
VLCIEQSPARSSPVDLWPHEAEQLIGSAPVALSVHMIATERDHSTEVKLLHQESVANRINPKRVHKTVHNSDSVNR